MVSRTKTRDAYLRRTYGITLKQYEALLKKQKGLCAVCGKSQEQEKRNFAVDHDHVSKEVRGILCAWCNHKIVGRHRNFALLEAAARYLKGPFTGWFMPVKRKRKRRKKKK